MAIIYRKTFKPVHVNMDAELLGRLDEYRCSERSRTQLIHEAIELYLEKLENPQETKGIWKMLRN